MSGSQDGTVRQWDLSALDSEPTVLRIHGQETIKATALSPDGHWLVTGSSGNIARLWDLSTPDPAVEPKVLRDPQDIQAVAMSVDRKWLVAAGWYDGFFYVWDLTQPELSPKQVPLPIGDDFVNTLAIRPNNQWLFKGTENGTAYRWELTDLDKTPVSFIGHQQAVKNLAISPDNRWLATASGDATVRLWDLAAPTKPPVAILPHPDQVTAVTFAAQQQALISASQDQQVRVWDLNNLKAEPRVLNHHGGLSALAVSSDNRWLAVGGDDGRITLWEFDDLSTSKVLSGHDHRVQTLAISANSRWLLSGSLDETARLWDLNHIETNPLVLKHPDVVSAVAISPDDRYLITGSWDGGVRLWALSSEDLIKQACHATARNFTKKEWDDLFAGQEYRQTCPEYPVHQTVQADLLAQLERTDNVLIDYSKAVSFSITTTDAKLNNALCWQGSLQEYVGIVLPACERAVQLANETNAALIRDSRGLARTLIGDYNGASADFNFALGWWRANNLYHLYGPLREKWLDALEKKQNPFNPATLEKLRNNDYR